MNLTAEQLWAYVIVELETATNNWRAGQPAYDHDPYTATDDDRAMVNAEPADLIAWIDDLETRVGIDTDEMREALHEFLDKRETERAENWLQPLARGDWHVVPFDPRGVYCAGAELENNAIGARVGLYVDPETGEWVTSINQWDAAGNCDAEPVTKTWHYAGAGAFDPSGAVEELRAAMLRIDGTP